MSCENAGRARARPRAPHPARSRSAKRIALPPTPRIQATPPIHEYNTVASFRSPHGGLVDRKTLRVSRTQIRSVTDCSHRLTCWPPHC
jgi:hypothetical protein